MRDNGPEPIFVQIKQTLRTSIELDAQLEELLATENRLGLTVTKRYVGNKYIEFVSFPETFTEAEGWLRSPCCSRSQPWSKWSHCRPSTSSFYRAISRTNTRP